MNPLAARKQLLIAESELNRAQLVEELAAWTAEARSLMAQARMFASIVSSTAMLMAGLTAWRRGQTDGSTRKRSWLRTIVKGAGLVSALWRTWHGEGREAEGELKG